VSLTLELAVPPAAAAALQTELGVSCRPLFARSARFAIGRAGDTALLSAEAAGADPRAALGGTLERADALDLLAAIQSTDSSLVASAALTYREPAQHAHVHFNGRWSDVYAALRARLGSASTLTRAEVEDELGHLLSAGVVRVDNGSRDGDGGLVAALLHSTSFVLEERAHGVYALRPPPAPTMPLDVTEELVGGGEGTVTLETHLADALGDALAGADTQSFVRLVAADPTSGRIRGVPPLVTVARSRAAPSEGPPRLSLAHRDGVLRTLPLELTPERRVLPSAAALIASDAVRPLGAGRIWLAQDVVAAADAAPAVSLPVVGDPGAATYPDRVDPRTLWYTPSFELVSPAASDDPSTSSFLFSFMTTGAAAGPGGLVSGLQATVRLTVRRTVPPAALEAIDAAGAQGKPVDLGNLSVSLELPFREAGSGETKQQLFAASAEDDGAAITATIGLLDDWARLGYGALAYAGFQSEPARLRIAYLYRAYRAVDPGEIDVEVGGKIGRTDIGRLPLGGRPVFDPDERVVRLPNAVLQLRREGGPSPARSRGPSSTLVLASSVRAEPESRATLAAPLALATIRPQLAVSPAIAALVRRVRYVTQSVVREETVDVLLPCSTFGNFYRQASSDGTERAVGCRDVLKLGETSYRQYEELEGLRDDRYRVLRSLQQPGRFLVLPAAYRITRYGPDEPPERAFRPAAILYGVVDRPPAGSRYFLAATLQPDIPLYARRGLARALAPFSPHGADPVLDYPTDPVVGADTAFHWQLPEGISQPQVDQVWDGFQVSVSTGLADALALTAVIEASGLQGDVAFTLPDGSSLASALVLDTEVVGPWESGPVTLAVAAGVATLTNRTEQAVNVSDLVVGAGPRAGERIPADVQLQAGASASLAVGDGTLDVYPVYDPVPQRLSLAQLNVFVEDVDANVLFVNQVNFQTRGLAALEVTAHLSGTDHDYSVTLADGQNGAIELTLPLTTYLDDQVLDFRLTKHMTSGEVAAGDWLSWDLKGAGAVVSITPEMVG
jgi:hypothetical protein